MNFLLRHVEELSTLAPINVYTDPAFLDVIATVYHRGKKCQVRDYVVDGDIFRLLEVEGLGPLTSQRFIDMHESLGRLQGDAPRLRALPRLDGVGGPLVLLKDFCRFPAWKNLFAAPTVLWSEFPTWEDYLHYSRHALVEDRRRGRRLREMVGEPEFVADDDAADVLPTCFAWKSERLLSLGLTDLFANPLHQRFFHELRERKLLRASTLRARGEILSIWLGAVYCGRWSGWSFAFNPDPALARMAPGQQIIPPMLELSYRERHAEFDFSIGLEPYKLKFATHVRPITMAGTPAFKQRAAAIVRGVLARHPALHEQARALRRRLSHTEPAVVSGQN